MVTISDPYRETAVRSAAAPERILSPSRPRIMQGTLPLPAILYLVSVVTPIMFNIGPLVLSGLRLYLVLLIIPLLFQLFSGRFGRVSAIDLLFMLHVAWMLPVFAVNNPSQAVTQVGSLGAEFLGGYLVGRAYIRTPEAFAALCRWVIFLVLCTTPFAILETQTGRPIIMDMIDKLPGIRSVSDVGNPPRMGLERAQVVFTHPIHYGLFCSVAFSLAFVALKDQTSTAKRYVTSFIVLVTGFLSLSSGSLLAMMLQLFLIIWATMFDSMRWRWWLLLGLACTAYIVIDILSNRSPVTAVLSRLAFSTHNLYWRVTIFEWGMKNVWANPIFGIGLNDWVRPHYMHSGSMDNFWLVMAVRYGIPGFLLLVSGYVIGIFRVMWRNFDADPVLLNFRRAWVFTFLGLSFTLSTVHVWINLYSFVFFLFGAGMWFITATPKMDDAPISEGDETERGHALPYTRFAGSRPGQTALQSGSE